MKLPSNKFCRRLFATAALAFSSLAGAAAHVAYESAGTECAFPVSTAVVLLAFAVTQGWCSLSLAPST